MHLNLKFINNYQISQNKNQQKNSVTLIKDYSSQKTHSITKLHIIAIKIFIQLNNPKLPCLTCPTDSKKPFPCLATFGTIN